VPPDGAPAARTRLATGPAAAVAPGSAEALAQDGARRPEAKATGREEAGLRAVPPAPRAPDEERTVACAGGPLRVRAWRDDAGRVRRVVRQLEAPGGVRTVVLAWDEAGRRTEARVLAPGPGGGAAPSAAELSPDPETAIADPRCP
jgi:hypothetical protein